jgi:transcriptional regulator with XRE-family HTH domain
MSPRSFKPDASLAALGEVLKALRREEGLTQERDLRGGRTSWSPNVSRIENGRRNLTWATHRLCHGLGVQRSAPVAQLEEAEPSDGERAP